MKDSKLRGIILKRFYDRRRENDQSFVVLTEEDFGSAITRVEAVSICNQLSEKGLIANWQQNMEGGGPNYGHGKISAHGIDVVEGEATAPIAIHFDNSTTYNVSGSSNVQMGNSNSIQLQNALNDLSTAIGRSDAPESEKEEAKTLLNSFLKHPIVVAITGGIAGSI